MTIRFGALLLMASAMLNASSAFALDSSCWDREARREAARERGMALREMSRDRIEAARERRRIRLDMQRERRELRREQRESQREDEWRRGAII